MQKGLPWHMLLSLNLSLSTYREQYPGASVIIPGPLDLAQPVSIHNFVNTYR